MKTNYPNKFNYYDKNSIFVNGRKELYTPFRMWNWFFPSVLSLVLATHVTGDTCREVRSPSGEDCYRSEDCSAIKHEMLISLHTLLRQNLPFSTRSQKVEKLHLNILLVQRISSITTPATIIPVDSQTQAPG